MFGLSPAEARLAVALHDGLSLTEIADRLTLSRETLRTQLRMVFDKTGTRRQGALIRLLADLAREGRLVRQRHAEARAPRPTTPPDGRLWRNQGAAVPVPGGRL
jgi:DNA-binding CsgD family transcriptional regulator